MRADSFASQVLAVIARRTPAFTPPDDEPQTFPGRVRALLSRPALAPPSESTQIQTPTATSANVVTFPTGPAGTARRDATAHSRAADGEVTHPVAAGEASTLRWDFFLSYTAADRSWAEWVAWQLEEVGYRVLLQAWEFVPGAHWATRMKEGIAHAQWTIVLLSNAYLDSVYRRMEWQAAFAADPSGFARKLLPVRVEDSPLPGMLGQIVSLDLRGLDEPTARRHLLDGISQALAGRTKPVPDFPRSVPPSPVPPVAVPNFPGSAQRHDEPESTGASASLRPRGRTHTSRLPTRKPTAPGRIIGRSGRVGSLPYAGPSVRQARHIAAVAVPFLLLLLVIPILILFAVRSEWGGEPDGIAHPTTASSPTPAPAEPPTVRPLGQPLAGHTGGVNEVAFSPDGRILATAGSSEVLLWDVTNPAASRRLAQPLPGPAEAVAFSPDGRILATAGSSEVLLWDVTNPAAPEQLGTPLQGPSVDVWSVAFSPDGRILATGEGDRKKLEGTVRLWDISDPAAPRTLGAPLFHPAYVRSVAFSPDGRILAAGSSEVLLWDVTNPAAPEQLGTPLEGAVTSVESVAFSPDGHTLATGGYDDDFNGVILLWDVSDPFFTPRPRVVPLEGRTDLVRSVAFSSDGRALAGGSDDGTVRLWG